jgi:hypothetical protein
MRSVFSTLCLGAIISSSEAVRLEKEMQQEAQNAQIQEHAIAQLIELNPQFGILVELEKRGGVEEIDWNDILMQSMGGLAASL